MLNSDKNNPRHAPVDTESGLNALLVTLILLVFLAFYITPVWDIDLWWHAATGRAILEQGALPLSDPLGVYQINDLRAEVLIDGYWLSQIVFHLMLDQTGTTGLILLRALLLVATLWFTLDRARRLGASPLWQFVIVILCGVTAIQLTGDRPALFSFLGVAMLLWLADSLRQRFRMKTALALALLMLLWSNAHGGAALGGVLLVLLSSLYLGEQLLTYSDENSSEPDWRVPLVLFGGALLTLATPNVFDLYRLILSHEGSELQSRTSEYLSPWALWREHGLINPGYWVMVCLALVSLPVLYRERRLRALVLVLFLLAISTQAFRYAPFFLFGAGPEIARGLTRMTARWTGWARIEVFGRWVIAAVAAAVLLWAVVSDRVLRTGVEAARFPVAAVDFLVQEGLQGRVFNHFNWGGYLEYRAPQLRPFIDGRNLDYDVFRRYTHMLWVTQQGREWLDREGFKLVISAPVQPMTGERYPLNDYLMRRPEWRLVYRDEVAWVFRREG